MLGSLLSLEFSEHGVMLISQEYYDSLTRKKFKSQNAYLTAVASKKYQVWDCHPACFVPSSSTEWCSMGQAKHRQSSLRL